MSDPDTDLRKFALEKAINALIRMTSVPIPPHDIVDVAEIFYEFLEGETK